MSRVIMTRHLGWLIPLFKLYVFSETSIMFPNLVVVSYSFLYFVDLTHCLNADTRCYAFLSSSSHAVPLF